MRYDRVPHEIDDAAQIPHIDTATSRQPDRVSLEQDMSPVGIRSFEPEMDPSSNLFVRQSGIFPLFTVILLVTSALVFLVVDIQSCSQPLLGWSLLYVSRHVTKTVLYQMALRRLNSEGSVPAKLILFLTIMDIAGPTIWALGGYFIFHTESCSEGLYTYAVVLWTLQSISLLLPCCFVSVILFCAPFLLWLAPLVIRPNPNTVATSRDALMKLPRLPFSSISDASENTCCTICLADYRPDEEVMRLYCGHFFHPGCITEWACLSQLCPVCRANIATAGSVSDESGDPV